MQVAALWRYPVKSLGGESLDVAQLGPDGVVGDRIVHVRGPRGPLTGRTSHGLVTIPVSTGPDGVPHVNGHVWDSDEALRQVRVHAGPDAWLVAYAGPERFDIGNLLVATDGAAAHFGHDVRRLRPNLLIGGVEPDAEADWPGHALAIGDAVVGLHSRRARCVVTSIDPDSGEHDPSVFSRIRREFNGQLALDAWVIRPGSISVGDAVELVPSDAQPEHLGGWIVGASYVDQPPSP
jgi:uncharacterized protein YcbX